MDMDAEKLAGVQCSRPPRRAGRPGRRVRFSQPPAALAARERTTAAAPLTNDVILASSCREAGVTLVTGNPRDFAAIQRHLHGFRFEATDDVIR